MASSTSDVSDEELDLFFQEWATQSKQLKIVVTGQVGSGKSALINTLIGPTDKNLGGEVAAEGDSVASVTKQVRCYALSKKDVDMVLYDTPGFLDPALVDPDLDFLTFAKIHTETGGQIDLLIVCKKMGSRLDSGDIRIMQQITEYMGESVWKNAVFVLTFANEVKPPRHRGAAQPPTKAESIENFEKKQKENVELFHKYLHEEGHVTADIAEEVPVVPAGYDDPSLPGCDNWYDVLWLTLCSRIKAASQPALLKVVHIPEARYKALSEYQLKPASLKEGLDTYCLLRNLAMQVPAINTKFLEWRRTTDKSKISTVNPAINTKFVDWRQTTDTSKKSTDPGNSIKFVGWRKLIKKSN